MYPPDLLTAATEWLLYLQNLPKAAPKDNSTHGIAVETSRSGGVVARALTIGVSSCQEKNVHFTKVERLNVEGRITGLVAVRRLKEQGVYFGRRRAAGGAREDEADRRPPLWFRLLRRIPQRGRACHAMLTYARRPLRLREGRFGRAPAARRRNATLRIFT